MRKLVIFVFLLFLTSCYSTRLPVEVINVIEEEDNNLCIMQGVQYKYKDTRKTYWQCRLRVMDQRIVGEFDNYGYSLLYQKEFLRLRSLIKKRVKEQERLEVAEMNSVIEEKEHNYCVALKNMSDNTIDIYDYFKCREDISNYRQNSNKNKYVVKVFEEEPQEINTNNDVISGECLKYVKNSEKLAQCQENEKKYNQCLDNLEDKLFQRQIDNKIYCTKTAIQKYPDSLAKYDNDNNTINVGPKIDKLNVLDLREDEYKSCIKDRNIKFSLYKISLQNSCKDENFKNN